MATDIDRINQKDKDRFRFLKHLYDKYERGTVGVNFLEAAGELGMDQQAVNDAVDYLKGEGLVEYTILGPMLRITHIGRVEVEDAIKKPQASTNHFPPQIINIIYNAGTINTTAFQQGNIASQQTVVIDEKRREDVLSLLKDLKDIVEASKGLETEKQEELRHELAMAESEAKVKKPKWDRVKSYLSTAKNIAEGTAIAIAFGSKVVLIMQLLAG